jgi:hypothetical protein
VGFRGEHLREWSARKYAAHVKSGYKRSPLIRFSVDNVDGEGAQYRIPVALKGGLARRVEADQGRKALQSEENVDPSGSVRTAVHNCGHGSDPQLVLLWLAPNDPACKQLGKRRCQCPIPSSLIGQKTQTGRTLRLLTAIEKVPTDLLVRYPDHLLIEIPGSLLIESGQTIRVIEGDDPLDECRRAHVEVLGPKGKTLQKAFRVIPFFET